MDRTSGSCYPSTRETQIEYIIATSEAHDSGLCTADRATKRRFATDLRNLTFASPRVNRHQKSGKDAGAWLPDRNRCWFAGRVLEVKRAYGLTVDRREAAAPERIFSRCYGTEMDLITCTGTIERRGRGRDGGACWRRRARPLRRQQEREDYVQGGAPARNRARAPVAPCIPVHARWGRRRGRVRVGAGDSSNTASDGVREEDALRRPGRKHANTGTIIHPGRARGEGGMTTPTIFETCRPREDVLIGAVAERTRGTHRRRRGVGAARM